MEYSQLSQDYQDDVLAEAIYQREREYFHYDFDRQNFLRMLATPEGAAVMDLERRLAETETQIKIVEQIHAALCSRIADPERYAAAVARVTAKRSA